jgi:hypothetical protein
LPLAAAERAAVAGVAVEAVVQPFGEVEERDLSTSPKRSGARALTVTSCSGIR